ncbi:hypothetical protein ACJQWK_01249 [Exserohilum turcicum]
MDGKEIYSSRHHPSTLIPQNVSNHTQLSIYPKLERPVQQTRTPYTWKREKEAGHQKKKKKRPCLSKYGNPRCHARQRPKKRAKTVSQKKNNLAFIHTICHLLRLRHL